jgi:tRNA(Arg) A34 adenosine deaminase TadA
MEKKFMQEAIELARNGIQNNEGGPFGAVVVKDGEVIGRGNNRVTSTKDPTAHAEIIAIRDACKNLGTFQLEGCEIYTSCEPCPMCLGAIYWARLAKVYYGCTKQDAADIDFDDAFIYKELELPLGQRQMPFMQMNRENTIVLFEEWRGKDDKITY